MSIPASKAELRRHLRRQRQDLSDEERHQQRDACVDALAAMIGESPLLSYVAVNSELDLSPLHTALWDQGHAVYLPRITAAGLMWHAVHDSTQLRPGAHAIPEPDAKACPPGLPRAPAIICVPGIGFSAAGDRLGQGGGYYDRCLPELTRLGLSSIGVGFACQAVDTIPHEPHDHRLDAVLLGARWLKPLHAEPGTPT